MRSVVLAFASVVLGTPPSLAQTPPLDFPAPTTTIPLSSSTLALGDLDRDGLGDAVYLDSYSSIAVARGDGYGRFVASPFGFSTVGWAAHATLVDLNGDGNLDLVTAQQPSSDLMTALGNGDGSFGAPSYYATQLGWPPDEVALGDVTNDGHLDAVVRSSGRFAIATGDGAGHFAALVTHPWQPLTVIQDIELGDFDEDGNLDFVVSESSGFPTTSLHVLRGDGTGGWSSDLVLDSSPTGQPFGTVAVGDYDRDGRLDFAHVQRDPTLERFVLVARLGDGAGGFAPALVSDLGPASALLPTPLLASDFDGNGQLDLACFDHIEEALLITANAGDAKFVVRERLRTGSVSMVAAEAYLDDNDSLDLVVLSGAGLVAHMRDALGGFVEPLVFGTPNLRFDVLAEDLDGDTLADLVTPIHTGHQLELYRSTGAGNFAGPFPLDVGSAPLAVASADFDGDGDRDLVSLDEGSLTISVLLNAGGGAFAGPATYAVGAAPSALAAADLDGDSRVDLAVADRLSSTVAVFRGDGFGSFGVPSSFATLRGPDELRALDVDADGDADLVTCSRHSGKIAVLLNDGAGAFADPLPSPTSLAGLARLDAGELTGDGHVDLVALAPMTGLTLLVGDGRGAFTPLPILHMNSLTDVFVGRLDADDELDVAVSSGEQSSVRILYGDGQGGFVERTSHVHGGTYITALAVADFDGDGERDVATVAESEQGGGRPISVSMRRAPPASAAFAIYCTAKTASVGCTPQLSASGIPSVGVASGFVIAATNVLAMRPGVLIYGTSGRRAVPFLGGTLCVAAPIRRTDPRSSSGDLAAHPCSGAYLFDFNAYVASGVDPSLIAGAQVDGQFWSRDPGFAPPNNVGLTEAIDFVLGPR